MKHLPADLLQPFCCDGYRYQIKLNSMNGGYYMQRQELGEWRYYCNVDVVNSSCIRIHTKFFDEVISRRVSFKLLRELINNHEN